MPNRINRNLLIAEAFTIALPISVLAVLGTGLDLNQTRRLIGFDFLEVQAIFSMLSLAAICSGWRLFIAYLRGGVDGLRQRHPAWWVLIAMGVLILFAALGARVLPPSLGHSSWWYFQSVFGRYVYAFPILIPLAHLAYERFFRKAPHKSQQRQQANTA